MSALDTLTRTVSANSGTTQSATNRTREAVISTGAPVQRQGYRPDGTFGPWTEVLDLAGADLRRLPGAAVLLDHRNDSRAVIGTVEAVRRDSSGIVASLKFGLSDLAQEIFRDVKDGMRRALSIGYQVAKWAKGELVNGVPSWRAVDWSIVEVSLVPVPSDPSAIFRNLGNNLEYRVMTATRAAVEGHAPAATITESAYPSTEATRQGAQAGFQHQPTPVATPDVAAEVARGMELERARAATIRRTAQQLGAPEAVAEDLVSNGTSLDAARAQLFDAWQHRAHQTQTRSSPAVGDAGADQTRAAIVEAIAARICPEIKVSAQAAQYRNVPLLQMDAAWAQASGQRQMERSGGFMTTSDMPVLLGAGINAAVAARFPTILPPLTAVATRREVNDFNPYSEIKLSDAPALLEVLEHGEIKRGSVTDSAESMSVRTFARIIPFTRNLIVNDRFDQLLTYVNSGLSAASGVLSQLLWDQIKGSGRVMADGITLWSANHGNLAAVGTALDLANLSAARAAMRNQTNSDGRRLGIGPKYLVVGAALESVAQQLVATLAPTTPAGVNPFSGALEVVVVPEIQDNSWFLLADQAQVPTLAYVVLNGQRPTSTNGSPAVDTRFGFDVLGVEIRFIYDVGAGVLNFAGTFRNPGL